MSNVAVVVLDTLRYDSFERHFDWLPGIRHESAYSTSHWTVPAHASILTGLYPTEVGVHGKSPSLNCSEEVLPETLQNEGFRTQKYTANPHIHIWNGWDRGFDTNVGPANLRPNHDDLVDWEHFYAQYDSSGIQKYAEAVWYSIVSDSPTVRSILQGIRLDRNTADGGAKSILQRVKHTDFGNNEFLLLNLMDIHTPYDPPSKYCDLDTPLDVVTGDAFANSVSNMEELQTAYDACVAYLSDMYKEVFEELRKDFKYVVTVSDHGEMLGEHGMWNHGYGLYPELVHVPLVVSGDGIESTQRSETVSLLDVYETVRHLAGVGPSEARRGRNLLSDVASRPVISEYHGFLTWHRDQFERKGVPSEVYDNRDTLLDGFATSEGDYAYQDHEEGLRTRGKITRDEAESQIENLTAELDRCAIEPGDSSMKDVSDDVRTQLEDLGYA